VEIPKGKYNGQKLIKLVRMKIPAKIKRIIARKSGVIDHLRPAHLTT
jgi:hypothetical protein